MPTSTVFSLPTNPMIMNSVRQKRQLRTMRSFVATKSNIETDWANNVVRQNETGRHVTEMTWIVCPAGRKLDPEGNTDRSSIRIQVDNRVDELPSEESDSRQMLT
ncbi:unnamed protein product [Nesidiocoris tenuis]|uniref:Uncharacterized protein n=1 Tax=Nesidiocoris tenuis TaxID=355587 RepID=A0A6H5HQ74_9HEMI|nr:unnamed protein product [Nesidiocoris tenuis]